MRRCFYVIEAGFASSLTAFLLRLHDDEPGLILPGFLWCLAVISGCIVVMMIYSHNLLDPLPIQEVTVFVSNDTELTDLTERGHELISELDENRYRMSVDEYKYWMATIRYTQTPPRKTDGVVINVDFRKPRPPREEIN